MFAKVNNASKYGFIEFVQQSNYKLIDSQVHTNHLESLGAKHISRKAYLDYLRLEVVTKTFDFPKIYNLPNNHNITHRQIVLTYTFDTYSNS